MVVLASTYCAHHCCENLLLCTYDLIQHAASGGTRRVVPFSRTIIDARQVNHIDGK